MSRTDNMVCLLTTNGMIGKKLNTYSRNKMNSKLDKLFDELLKSGKIGIYEDVAISVAVTHFSECKVLVTDDPSVVNLKKISQDLTRRE